MEITDSPTAIAGLRPSSNTGLTSFLRPKLNTRTSRAPGFRGLFSTTMLFSSERSSSALTCITYHQHMEEDVSNGANANKVGKPFGSLTSFEVSLSIAESNAFLIWGT